MIIKQPSPQKSKWLRVLESRACNNYQSRKYSNKFYLWYKRYITVYAYMQNRRIIIHFPNTDMNTYTHWLKISAVVLKYGCIFRDTRDTSIPSVDSKYCWAVKMIIIRPRQVKTKN